MSSRFRRRWQGQTLTLSYDSTDTGTAVDPLGWIQSPTTSSLEIIGPTSLANGFTINANNATRVFDVGFVTIQGGSLVLSNLTVQNGNGVGTRRYGQLNGDGGAIFLAGGSQLTLNNVALRNNSATRGGAIFASGSATITNNGGSYIGNAATGGTGRRWCDLHL